jgi:hypothetical protein
MCVSCILGAIQQYIKQRIFVLLVKVSGGVWLYLYTIVSVTPGEATPGEAEGAGRGMGAVQVNIEAYLLWEKAGRPEGADFSTEARRTLEDQLRSGKTLQDLERILKAPPPPAPESPAAPPASSNGASGNGAGVLYCSQPLLVRGLTKLGACPAAVVQSERL